VVGVMKFGVLNVEDFIVIFFTTKTMREQRKTKSLRDTNIGVG
jgi:hypothetical protein